MVCSTRGVAVLKFHSLYHDFRNKLSGANGWSPQDGRYVHSPAQAADKTALKYVAPSAEPDTPLQPVAAEHYL